MALFLIALLLFPFSAFPQSWRHGGETREERWDRMTKRGGSYTTTAQVDCKAWGYSADLKIPDSEFIIGGRLRYSLDAQDYFLRNPGLQWWPPYPTYKGWKGKNKVGYLTLKIRTRSPEDRTPPGKHFAHSDTTAPIWEGQLKKVRNSPESNFYHYEKHFGWSEEKHNFDLFNLRATWTKASGESKKSILSFFGQDTHAREWDFTLYLHTGQIQNATRKLKEYDNLTLEFDRAGTAGNFILPISLSGAKGAIMWAQTTCQRTDLAYE